MKTDKLKSLINKIKGLNPLTLAVAISLSVVLLFGVILGTVLIVRNANACITLNGTVFNKGVCSYFASSYKTEYIAGLQRQGINASDTDTFWKQKTIVDGKELTYGDLLKINTEAYLKGIIVGNYLFDRYGKLTDEDKAKINEVINDTLTYGASSSKKEFNELSEKYGFDYSDFVDAVTYKYKAQRAKSLIYGDDGSSMSGAEYREVCNKYYYDNYARTLLVFVRTETTFVKDENGKLVITTDDDGNSVYEKRYLSDSEIGERKALIDKIKSNIDAINSGTEPEAVITAEYLSDVAAQYPLENNISFIDTGYYFGKNSAYTNSFPIDAVADMAKNLKLGEYDCVGYDDNNDGKIDGVCFALGLALEDSGYSKSANKEFFTDFYYNLSVEHYSSTLEELSSSVNIKDKFYDIDLITLPYNSLFAIRF